MRVFAENENRDLFTGSNNQLVMRTGLQAVLQACQSIIEAQRGELQYNRTRGIPTASTIWAGVTNQQRFRFFCIEALKTISGVTAVKRFNSDIVGSVLQYETEIKTEFGIATIRGSLSAL